MGMTNSENIFIERVAQLQAEGKTLREAITTAHEEKRRAAEAYNGVPTGQ